MRGQSPSSQLKMSTPAHEQTSPLALFLPHPLAARVLAENQGEPSAVQQPVQPGAEADRLAVATAVQLRFYVT